jgi:nucleoside-diphosphate-sugar epimerase
MGTTATIETEHERLRPQASEVFRLCCGNEKIGRLTGHSHKIALREGLARTIEWLAKPSNLGRYKPASYNV